MNTSLALKIVFSAAAFGFMMFQAVSAQNYDDKTINSFIAKQTKVNKAEEYSAARKIIKADLNGDKRDDAAVLYTLESFNKTNLYVQYLAVFLGTKRNSLRYAAGKIIGGKNQRSVELVSIKDGKIFLDTLNYLRTDASCCPSEKKQIKIILEKNKLREVEINQ